MRSPDAIHCSSCAIVAVFWASRVTMESSTFVISGLGRQADEDVYASRPPADDLAAAFQDGRSRHTRPTSRSRNNPMAASQGSIELSAARQVPLCAAPFGRTTKPLSSFSAALITNVSPASRIRPTRESSSGCGSCWTVSNGPTCDYRSCTSRGRKAKDRRLS